jgi:hypothetical protein
MAGERRLSPSVEMGAMMFAALGAVGATLKDLALREWPSVRLELSDRAAAPRSGALIQ